MSSRASQPLAIRLASSEGDRSTLILATISAAICGMALAAHASVGLSARLWLDEGWTGALASLTSLPDLLSFARDDSNAPAYYLAIWAWAKLFGTSDVALHVPSLLFSLAAPLAAWHGLRKARPRLALTWAVAVGLWGPGITQSGYARCYPLLLLCSVVCCACFVRLLDAPGRGRALAWAASGAAVIMTHYHGTLLVAMQATIWVALHRRRALSCWPAALAFVPPAACLIWHLPVLLTYARPGVAWYSVLPPEQLPLAAAAAAGVPFASFFVLLAALLLLELLAHRGRGAGGTDRSIGAAGLAALAAAVLLLTLCCVRPLFSPRYFTSFAPGVLLLIADRLVAASHGRTTLLALLLGGYALLSAEFWLGLPPRLERTYTYEAASAWLAEAQPRRLVFFFDNTSALAMTTRLLDRIGGFFLRRDGLEVAVEPIMIRPGADMNGAMLAEGGDRTAFLWLSEVNTHDTTARFNPPRLAEMRSDLECRDFGAGTVGIYACRPRSSL